MSLTSIDPARAARLTGSTTLPLLGKNDVSVIAQLALEDGKARLVVRDARFGGKALPASLQRSVSQLFAVTVDPGSLPLKVTPTELTAVDGTLQISGTASDLTLGGGSNPAG